MQTHKDIWFSVSDEHEHIYFRAFHTPHPVLDFIPWPIRVSGIFFPDGTSMISANSEQGPPPTLIAGNGISLSYGIGTVTVTNADPGVPQTPWQSNINGAGFSLSNASNISVNGNVSANGYFASGEEGITASFLTADLFTVTVTNGIITRIVGAL